VPALLVLAILGRGNGRLGKLCSTFGKSSQNSVGAKKATTHTHTHTHTSTHLHQTPLKMPTINPGLKTVYLGKNVKN